MLSWRVAQAFVIVQLVKHRDDCQSSTWPIQKKQNLSQQSAMSFSVKSKPCPRSLITCCCSQGNMRHRSWKLGQLEAILIREIRSPAAPHDHPRDSGGRLTCRSLFFLRLTTHEYFCTCSHERRSTANEWPAHNSMSIQRPSMQPCSGINRFGASAKA